MSSLQEQFDLAVTESKQLPARPEPQTLLQLYSLYKQATIGDNREEKPSFTDIVARVKWESWDKLGGTPAAEAMQQYIELVKKLQTSLA